MPTIQITAKSSIPSSYNVKLQRTQWYETTTSVTLPAGKIWTNRIGEYTSFQALDRGMTHFSKYDLVNMAPALQTQYMNEGRGYDEVPRPEHFLGLNPVGPDNWVNDQYNILYNTRWWPNGPFNQQQAESKADQMGTGYALFIAETEEGNSWVSPDHPMWGWLWTRYKQRMSEKWDNLGIQYYISHNYFHDFGRPVHTWANMSTTSREETKIKFARPANQWETTRYSTGGSLANTNLIIEAVYLGAPDSVSVKKDILQKILNHMSNKKMGFFSGTVAAGNHEWRGNNYQSTEFAQEYYPNDWGMHFRSTKLFVDPSDLMSYAIWGLEFGDLYNEWGAGGKSTSDKIDFGCSPVDYWYPKGSLSDTGNFQIEGYCGISNLANSFPYYSSTAPYRSNSNWSAFGVHLYAETLGTVTGSGSTAGFCEYRINGGSWVVPQVSEANEIIDCFHDERAFVRWRRKDGKIALGYLNQVAPNTKVTLEIKHPTISNLIYTTTVCGNASHMFLINE